MASSKKNDHLSKMMWFISEETHFAKDAFSGTAMKAKKEYRISSLARYLINPHPIEVQKKLIGYKLIKRKTCFDVFKTKLKRLFPQKKGAASSAAHAENEAVYVSQTAVKDPSLKDTALEIYLQKIEGLLRAYHPALDTLNRINPVLVNDISGICAGLDGNQSSLNIRGSVRDKLRYLEQQLFENVSVILGKAHISKGLFELEGFDFTDYDPARSYRLVKSFENNTCIARVMKNDRTCEFSLQDPRMIEYLFLLELGLQVNPKLRDVFRMFIEQEARPLRLFFNDSPLIDYTKAPFPSLYQTLAARFNVDLTPHIEMMAESLNQFQVGLALSYFVTSETENDQIITDIALLHDIKALKMLKQHFPMIHAEIKKKTVVSKIGNFYLLDCFQGCKI